MSKIGAAFWPGIAVFVMAVPVLIVWATAAPPPETVYLTLGGMLPWSDSLGQLFSGLHLLYEGGLDVFGTRRALASAFNASRFLLGGGSLQGMIAAQTVLLGIAVFFFSRELRRTHGRLAAVIAFAACLFAAYTNLATYLTEIVGLAFGATAMAVLWRAVAVRDRLLFAFGVLVLAVGLNIRPGDAVILPFCVLAPLLLFTDGRPRWPGMTAAVLAVMPVAVAVLLAIGGAVLWDLWFGHPQGAAQSNFYYTLYGLSVGGNWGTAFQDHPGLLQKLAAEHERVVALALRDEAIRNIMADPTPLLATVWRNFQAFWTSTPLYGYTSDMGRGSFLALGLGGIALLSVRKSAFDRLIALGIVSTALSSAISFGDGGWKAASTTAPFWAAAAALAGARLTGWLTGKLRPALFPVSEGDFQQDKTGIPGAVWFGGGLVLLATVIPAVVVTTGVFRPAMPPPALRASCPEGQTGIIMRPGRPAGTLHVRGDDDLPHSFVPYIRTEDLERSLTRSTSELAPHLKDIPARHAITLAYDLTRDDPALALWSMRAVYVIAPEGLLPRGKKAGWVAVCGGAQSASPFGPRVLRVMSAYVLR